MEIYIVDTREALNNFELNSRLILVVQMLQNLFSAFSLRLKHFNQSITTCNASAATLICDYGIEFTDFSIVAKAKKNLFINETDFD
jgi:hypothetical protein